MIFSTHSFSILATSLLKELTSSQQFKGFLSLSSKHLITCPLAFSTPSSSFRTVGLEASFSFKASISFATWLLFNSLRASPEVAAGSASDPGPANGTRGASRDIGESDVVDDSAVGVVSANRFSMSARVCVSRARIRSSSSATRAWIWSSRLWAREESV